MFLLFLEFQFTANKITLAAKVVDVFVGDTFESVDFVTPGLSNVDEVFGLLSVVERRVDETGADLTRDAADETVEVVFVAATFDVAVVAVAGLVAVLYESITNI